MTRDVPPAEVARVMAAITAGFMVQYALVGDVDADMFRDGVRALATMRPLTGPPGGWAVARQRFLSNDRR
jgi:hypothetical protein